MDSSNRKPFILFATLFEASMIDKQLEKKPIYFEISMGQCVSNTCTYNLYLLFSLQMNICTAIH